MGNEREPDGWLGTMLRQTPAAASDACLDAEMLAAWADGGLSVKAAAAVELHASSCARCTAVLATLERSAPAVSPTHVWTPARVFRWLAPLAAAATAVAIWIAVPERPLTRVAPAPAHDLASPAPEAPNQEPGARNLEPGTANQSPAPSTQSMEPQANTLSAPSARLEKEVAEPELMRDELRRDRAAQEALGATAGAAPAVPEAVPPAAVADSVPPAAPPAAPSSDTRATLTLRETVVIDPQQRSAFTAKMTVTSEATSPVNQLVRWRVIDSVSIERSTDGGKTWTRTIQIPAVGTNKPDSLTVLSIRAVNDVTAIARCSDGRDFVTSNGGLTWIQAVQEKPAAPF
jgi:hypothetical protein